MKKLNATDYQLYLNEVKLMNDKVDEMNAIVGMIAEIYAIYLLDREHYDKLRKEVGNTKPFNIDSLTNLIVKELQYKNMDKDTFNFFNKHSKNIATILQMYIFSTPKIKLSHEDTQKSIKFIIKICRALYEHVSIIEKKVDDFNLFIENNNINVLDIEVPYPNELITTIKAKLPKKQGGQIYNQLCDELKQGSSNNICKFMMSPLPLGDNINDLENFKKLKKNNSSIFVTPNLKDSEYEYEFTLK